MLAVGEKFPSFSLSATVNGEQDPSKALKVTTDLDFADKWKVYFFWPKDFMADCLKEVASFAQLNDQFQDSSAQVLGCSIDSEFAHLAWRNASPELKDLPFPLLADIKRELCGQLGILDNTEGVPQRAAFIVDPSGVIQFVSVVPGSVDLNPEEVVRVLHALHSDEPGAGEQQTKEPAPNALR
jgi:alkyl hydroperoxide reductase subunit AhpC